IARSSFSGLANRLEQRGLIQRRQSPNDGRAVLFSLTEQGRIVLERVWPELNRCEQQLSEHLGPDGRRELADALRSVADQLTTLLQHEAAVDA
ncbi:MAG: MarR family transcriptional regulator, partial [Acidimicrobiaceae bacterium]|nr:MarR family transcriptional regulator [Acidimicrobiaceae bacterium]